MTPDLSAFHWLWHSHRSLKAFILLPDQRSYTAVITTQGSVVATDKDLFCTVVLLQQSLEYLSCSPRSVLALTDHPDTTRLTGTRMEC